MAGIKELVDSTISSKPVVVFSKSYCPFCVKVKELFQKEIQIPADKLEIMELENRPDHPAIQTYLKELTGASSVSAITSSAVNSRLTFTRHTHARLNMDDRYLVAKTF